MNYESKFNGISSEYLMLMTRLKVKARQFPWLKKDLADMELFYDELTQLFKVADAEAVTAKVELVLLRATHQSMEVDYNDLLKGLLEKDPDNAQTHLKNFIHGSKGKN